MGRMEVFHPESEDLRRRGPSSPMTGRSLVQGQLPYRRVAVVLNPAAGRGRAGRSRAQLERTCDAAFQGLGRHVAVSVQETAPNRSACSIAREAVIDGADLVVAAGGDGTLNGVLNGMLSAPGDCAAALGLVPLGTGDDLARALDIPRSVEGALSVLAAGRIRQLDVGLAGERRFLNVAGCGFDAAVAERINRSVRLLSGRAAYIWAVLDVLRGFRPADMVIRVDDAVLSVSAMMCAVANGTGYGGGMRIAPDARLDDGLLDVCVIAACGRLEFVRAFPRVFRGTHVSHPKVHMLRGRTVHIVSEPAFPVLVDGELEGHTPVIFTVAPRAVRFVVP